MNADDPASNLMRARGFGKKEMVRNAKFEDRISNYLGSDRKCRPDFLSPTFTELRL
jgi:hypothetical protein